MSREERCRAEALAWPLVDPTAFADAAVALEPGKLLPLLEQRLRALGMSGHGDQVARAHWRPGPLAMWLHHLANAHLERWGEMIRLTVDHEVPGREILRWRWLTLALPPHLLLASLSGPELRPVLRLRLLDPAIAPPGPIAHQHLHAGAVHPFPMLWTRLMSSLPLETIAEDGKPPADLGRWLVRAAIARRWLAHRWWGTPLLPSWLAGGLTAVQDALDELAKGKLRPTRHRLDRDPREVLLRRIATWHPSGRVRNLRGLEDVWSADPVTDGQPWPDGRWLQHGILARSPLAKEATLFWQVVRISVTLFRHLMSDVAATGLTPFTATYGRIRHYVCDLETIGLDVATDEPDLRLGAIEVRGGFPKNATWLLNQIATRQPVAGDEPCHRTRCEWGWTYHLIRGISKLDPDGKERNHPGRVLARQHRDYHLAATTLIRLMDREPLLLHVIRGLDIAGDERHGPLWIALPSLWRALARSREIAAAHGHLGVRPLRCTIHAGEDFRHPLTGLRAVHEPFALRLLRPGDRIGHAVALGMNVRSWRASHAEVSLPRLERLEDLLWALDPERRDPPPLDGTQVHALRHQVEQHATTIWDRTWPELRVGVLGWLRMQRDPTVLPRLLDHRDRPTNAAEALLAELLRTERCATEAYRPVTVPVHDWEVPWLEAVQRQLRIHLARHRIAVELNPSSNLAVAGMQSPLDQPAFRMHPLGGAEDAVAVTLNADDPLCFSTSLGHEIAYAWAGLVTASISPTLAMGWLREATETSWRTRFTHPASAKLRGRIPAFPQYQFRTPASSNTGS